MVVQLTRSTPAAAIPPPSTPPTIECVVETGAPITPFLKAGDRVRIWMDDENNNSIFGAIDQTVAPWEG